jgi:spore maturation protein SpmA
MLNGIWLGMIVVALVCGALTGRMEAVAKASTDSASSAVQLAIGLVGVMTFWIGLMRVLQDAGVLKVMARALRPIMVRLFPDVPADHPAMSMMLLNFIANMLGLANAATPFGLKAMTELDKLNKEKGTATNAMALFLAINTSGLALLPTGVIGLRASLGSSAPGSIIITTFLGTLCGVAVAIITTKLLIRANVFPVVASAGVAPSTAGAQIDLGEAAAQVEKEPPPVSPNRRLWSRVLAVVVLVSLAYGFWLIAFGVPELVLGLGLAPEAPPAPLGAKEALKAVVSQWALPLLIGAFVLFGFSRNVKVYDSIVEGGKEGFQVAVRIIPYLVTILVGVGMLRASGGLGLLELLLAPGASAIGMPPEALPMALMRPLSGNGAFGVAAELMKTHGPDSLIGQIVSTMNGNETTFYVLALYFGVVQVRNTRFTLIPCLVSDLVGIVASVWIVRAVLG